MFVKTASEAFVDELFKIAVSKEDHKLYALLMENQELLIKEAGVMDWVARRAAARAATKATEKVVGKQSVIRAGEKATEKATAKSAGKAAKAKAKELAKARAADKKLYNAAVARNTASPGSVDPARLKALKASVEGKGATSAAMHGGERITAENLAGRGFEPINTGILRGVGNIRAARATGGEAAKTELALLGGAGTGKLPPAMGGRTLPEVLAKATPAEKNLASAYYNVPVKELKGTHIHSLGVAKQEAVQASRSPAMAGGSPAGRAAMAERGASGAAGGPDFAALVKARTAERSTAGGVQRATAQEATVAREAEAARQTASVEGRQAQETANIVAARQNAQQGVGSNVPAPQGAVPPPAVSPGTGMVTVPPGGAGTMPPPVAEAGAGGWGVPVPAFMTAGGAQPLTGMGIGAGVGGGVGLLSADEGHRMAGLASGALGGAMLGGVAGAGVRAAGGMTKLKDMFKVAPAAKPPPAGAGAVNVTPKAVTNNPAAGQAGQPNYNMWETAPPINL